MFRPSRSFVVRLLLVSFLVGFYGCGETTSPGDSKHTGQRSSDVRVLDASARQSLKSFKFEASNNRGTLRFDASNPFAQEIEQGRILASRPIEGVAPAGLLQRVKSVSEQGGTIVVTTRQATLAETFKRADIDVNRDITADDIEQTQTLKQGVTFRARQVRQGVSKPFELTFDEVLIDADDDKSTTDDQLTLNGKVGFGASFDADIDIGAFKLKRFLFAVNMQESVELEVEGDFEGTDFNERVRVSTHNLDTIKFNVAGVPVVIKIDLWVYIGVEGNVTAELRASAAQSASLRVGAEYDGSGWSGINESSGSFNAPPPTFNLNSINARGYARPELQITLYGVAGPYVFAKPFVRFDAKRFRSPYWQLSGGLSMGVGFVVKVPVLGRVADWEKEFSVFEEDITQSSNKPPELTIESPQDGATITAGENANIEVRVFDREQSELPVTVRRIGVGTVADKTIPSGGTREITLPRLCEGSLTLRLTVEDKTGATDSETISLVVENATPKVDISVGDPQSDSTPRVFPGGYVSATADVTDPRCPDKSRPNEQLTEWYLNGERVGTTADLLTRLSPSRFSVGDTISLQASFDDGQAVGRSDVIDLTLESKPEGGLPPEANITECRYCDEVTVIAISQTELDYIANRITARGVGYDPIEGRIAGDALQWEFETPSGRVPVGTGRKVNFKLEDHLPTAANRESFNRAIGTWTLYLTVTDSDGNSVETEYEIHTFPSG
jgi:hypothetical protein